MPAAAASSIAVCTWSPALFEIMMASTPCVDGVGDELDLPGRVGTGRGALELRLGGAQFAGRLDRAVVGLVEHGDAGALGEEQPVEVARRLDGDRVAGRCGRTGGLGAGRRFGAARRGVGRSFGRRRSLAGGGRARPRGRRVVAGGVVIGPAGGHGECRGRK